MEIFNPDRQVSMKKVADLNFGFNDAVNYKKPENRELFERIFFKTEEFEKLFSPSNYFIIGEKGTGKTAYATYVVTAAHLIRKGFLITSVKLII